MSVLLDTNVASEVLRPLRPYNVAVHDWFDGLVSSEVRLCRIVDAEIRFGAYAHRDDRQTVDLIAAWEGLIARFQMLEYSPSAARQGAMLRGKERRKGRQIGFPDAAIAGIALANDCTLATRNTKDFEGSGLILVNPFDPQE